MLPVKVYVMLSEEWIGALDGVTEPSPLMTTVCAAAPASCTLTANTITLTRSRTVNINEKDLLNTFLSPDKYRFA